VNSKIMSESEGNGRGKGAERLMERHGGWSAAVRPSKSADLSLHPYAYTPTRLRGYTITRETRPFTIAILSSYFFLLMLKSQLLISIFIDRSAVTALWSLDSGVWPIYLYLIYHPGLLSWVERMSPIGM
jgi:hypothetical protein